jgi:polyisoprenoid-binding protein YceI
MRTILIPLAALAALSLAACNSAEKTAAPASETQAKSWSLVSDQSRLSFVSVKAGEIAEVHHFASLTGTVTPAGQASISIPLDSVNTGIELRDDRMRTILFEIANHPTATFTAAIDLAAIGTLAVGEQRRMPLAGQLSLHGLTAPVETQVVVTRAADGKVLVASLDPVVVNAASFGLTAGLAELQKLANLPGITPDVPVSFQLTFTRDA